MDVAGHMKSRRGTKKGALKLHQRARALGVPPTHLSKVLSGKRDSSILVIRLAKLIEAESATEKPTIEPTEKRK
jgi:plasmid maintenance system antidote protein VapI